MGMALEDRTAGFQRNLEQGIGNLAETAAGRGDHAAFLQHAAGDKTAGPTWIAELLPEAEDFAGRDHQSVEMLRSAAQILDLAKLDSLCRGSDQSGVSDSASGTGRVSHFSCANLAIGWRISLTRRLTRSPAAFAAKIRPEILVG
jgi:hypothetical protein